MNEPPKLAEVVCPYCDAVNRPHLLRCWVCSQELSPNSTPIEAASSAPKISTASWSQLDVVSLVLLIACVGVTAAIAFGCTVQDWGSLPLVLFVLGPALGITASVLVFGSFEKSGTSPYRFLVGTLSVIAAVLSGVVAAIALVIGLIAAIIAGFFLVCQQLLSGQG